MKKIFLSLCLIGTLSLALSLFTTSVFAADELFPPEKTYPAPNQKDVPSTVTFEWKNVTGADKYEIVVWFAGGKKQAAQKILTETEKTFKLEEGIVYWWDVRACHATGLFGLFHDCKDQEFGGYYVFTTKGTAPLEITTTELANGTVGLEYEEKILHKGGVPPFTWSIKKGDLPPGFDEINKNTGVIKGRPTEWKKWPGWKFKVRVVDSSLPTPQIAESKELKIFVSVAELEITTDNTLLSGVIGENYYAALEAKGGIPPYEWKSAPLAGDIYPKGLNISSDGIISGLPLKGGSFKFGVRVNDSFPETLGDLKQFFVEIESLPLEIITTNLPAKELGKEYFIKLEARGGAPPYLWSKTAGTLPNGLNLSDGTISGTPTKEGTFGFTMLLTDADETDKAQVLSIKINPLASCGNKICESDECATCPGDCTITACCGNGTCDSAVGESTGNCPEDCGAPSELCGNGACNPGECRSECATDCTVSDCCGIEGCNTAIGETVENCRKDCIATSGTVVTTSNIPEGRLEVSWPNSPMGTPLNDDSNLVNLIKYLYEWGIGLGGLAAFIALVIAGFQYLTSAGNAMKMKDAMDRIKSAGFGLVLLLGSFLILNTINPQLTELKMPTIPPGSVSLKSIMPEGTNPLTTPCKKAILYNGPNNGKPYITIPSGGQKETLPYEIGSVKIEGNCQVILYKLSYPDRENADNIPVVISGDVPNVRIYGGTTEFKWAETINISSNQ